MSRRRCCCPTGCTIDSFTTAVEVTAASTTTIRTPSHPQSPYPFWLRVEIKVDSDASHPRLFVSWTASSDGIYVDFTFESPVATGGFLQVFRQDGTQLGADFMVDGLVSGEWHTVTICSNPDNDPDYVVVCVDPAGTGYPSQCANFKLPTGFAYGLKAGYGTTASHSGSAFFRNYQYDKLWFCGDGTEDCFEKGESWDYYNDIPARIDCDPCLGCPDGPTISLSAHWKQVSGTWTFNAFGASTASSNAELISWTGQAEWNLGAVAASLTCDDEVRIGMSDILGYNQIYIECTIADAANHKFSWEVFKVVDGGAPVSIAGPTTTAGSGAAGATSSVQLGFYYDEDNSQLFWFLLGGWGGVQYEQTVALHTTNMRHFLLGTGTNTSGSSATFLSYSYPSYGYFLQCGCAGGAMPRHFTATVSGVAEGTGIPCYSTGLTPATRPLKAEPYNRSGVTLYNTLHLLPFCDTRLPCIGYCCFSNFDNNWSDPAVVPDPYDVETSLGISYDGEYTTLTGQARACQYPINPLIPSCGWWVSVVLVFTKQIFGQVDPRTLSGEVLTFSHLICNKPTAPSDVLDATGATMTITAVP